MSCFTNLRVGDLLQFGVNHEFYLLPKKDKPLLLVDYPIIRILRGGQIVVKACNKRYSRLDFDEEDFKLYVHAVKKAELTDPTFVPRYGSPNYIMDSNGCVVGIRGGRL